MWISLTVLIRKMGCDDRDSGRKSYKECAAILSIVNSWAYAAYWQQSHFVLEAKLQDNNISTFSLTANIDLTA